MYMFCLFPGQLVVCTLCSCVMQTKRIWLFSAHLLPLVARLCLVPLETIVFINRFSMIFTGLEVIYFLASNLLVPYNLAKTAYRELAQVIAPLFRFTTTVKPSSDQRFLSCVQLENDFQMNHNITLCNWATKPPASIAVAETERLR